MSSHEKIISDLSKSKLTVIPADVLTMTNLKMLFLEGNFIERLPDNFFPGLPNLMWLDLRNNVLEALPKTIANHHGLENLLVSNNKLKKLPNELGLVPNLKALQLQNNPLIYPVREIIEAGTKAIKNYLKEQYNMQYKKLKEIENRTEAEKRDGRMSASENEILNEEELINVVDQSESMFKKPSNIQKDSSLLSKKESKTPLNKPRSRESKDSRVSTKSSREKSLESYFHSKLVSLKKPSELCVKKIDFPNKNPKNVGSTDEPLKIIHTINKSDSKISLRSYFNKSGIKGTLDQIPENSLKEGWLNKLRILLNDQERILQQERNLRALTEWRDKQPKQGSPKIFYDDDYVAKKVTEYPYDTDPAYAKIPSREELTNQLNQFLSNTNLSKSSMQTSKKSSMDMDKMINDLMEQLKEMERGQKVDGNLSRNEMEDAERQIKTIIKIHKELLKLRTTNESL